MLENPQVYMMKTMLYSGIERAAAYVQANLYRSLSISDICTSFAGSVLLIQNTHVAITDARRIHSARQPAELGNIAGDLDGRFGFGCLMEDGRWNLLQ